MAKTQTKQKIEVPKGLKILCILSFIGFAVSMSIDTMNYLGFSSLEGIEDALDQTAFEQMEDFSEKLEDAGVVQLESNGLIPVGFSMRIAKMYIFRAIIDVLALLGVSMMFIQLRMGFTVYVIAQLAYIAVPIGMFGPGGIHIIEGGSIVITLIYILLFATQRRHLIR